MIVRERPNAIRLLFVLRGSVLPKIYPQLLFVFALSSLVVVAHRLNPALIPGSSAGPFAFPGIALSIFLGFRNNVCYDRWWEARKDWGMLIHSIRDLARQTAVLRVDDRGTREVILRLAMAFAHTLVVRLRPGADRNPIWRRLPKGYRARLETSVNAPDFILREIGTILASLSQAGRMSDVQHRMLDDTLGRMAAAQAACERIRNTPVPFAYSLLVHRTAHIFCLLLPFGFADALGWATPFMTLLVAYAFFGLDALGDELEDPFGMEDNDLPIQFLAETIEIGLREALGEVELDVPVGPEAYILR